jgi:major vault protein
MVLTQNEFAYVLDQTKGHVTVYVGPAKASLSATDQPVVWNEDGQKFLPCELQQAIQVWPLAAEGSYIVLNNPAKEGDDEHPTSGSNSLPRLTHGRKINIPGPITFPLWPGQSADVVGGHHLRSNQYLLVRVYDEERATASWGESVIKPQAGGEGQPPKDEESEGTQAGGEGQPPKDEESEGTQAGGEGEGPQESGAVTPSIEEVPDLTMGRLLVIKGTDVSFFIPPTGIEVVKDDRRYVRDAVTLERLEYCILLDEDGNKRYIKGPDVVFPEPTETFVEENGSRKFRAIELNELQGLYIKVIAAYSEGDKEYKEGDEIFITGKDQMIYFPRPEHAIIKYGEEEKHFAVVVPNGEGRYVLDRLKGKIDLVRGPRMLLCDPRTQVVVRRALDPKLVDLWFPSNREALDYNAQLRELTRAGGAEDFIDDQTYRTRALGARRVALRSDRRPEEDQFLAGDEFERRPTFTPPRTITLDTKYDGAVSIDVWTGYAVLVVSRSGERKMVVGPSTVLLEYDEILEAMTLSTGTPKTDANPLKTVYLRVMNNKVSDEIEAETGDLCRVTVQVSYRVNFGGDPKKWFDVEDYVKILTDHMRSMIKAMVKQHGIEDFYQNSTSIIRDTVLGEATGEGRTGRIFEENGMRIYDVEVLGVEIGDEEIAEMLTDAQHSTVEQTIEVGKQERRLEATKRTELINRQIDTEKHVTQRERLKIQGKEIAQGLVVALSNIRAEVDQSKARLDARIQEQGGLDRVNKAELARLKSQEQQRLEITKQELQLRLEEIAKEVEAVVAKAGAISPALISAMQSFGDNSLMEELSKSMAPLAILGGTSVIDVARRLINGTGLEKGLEQLQARISERGTETPEAHS